MASDEEKFIRFSLENSVAKLSHDASLLELLEKCKIPINSTCGGNGTCGTCLIHVDEDYLIHEPRNENEAEMALDRGYKDSERLACQLNAAKAISLKLMIKVPKESL